MFYQNIISKLQYFLIFTIATFLFSCTKGKGAICNDGWRSHSIGSGTCSWHGGIDHYIDPNEIDSFKTTVLVIFILVVLFILFILFLSQNQNKK
jgi:hypothetical protein